MPPDAKQEAADFIEFLQERSQQSENEKESNIGKLEDEPFVGMWENREDLKDSALWVRNLRKSEWNN